MDFKNKLKNFWRLNAQSAKGFTLVELIVVIAILAILAGIAVPAYSGYVEKANKAADEQLLANVNTAFAAACIENGTDNYNVKNAPTFDVDTMTLNHEYKEDFETFFEGNDGEFKVYTALFYNRDLGMFTVMSDVYANLIGYLKENYSDEIGAVNNSVFNTIGYDALAENIDLAATMIASLAENPSSAFYDLLWDSEGNIATLYGYLDGDEAAVEELFMAKYEQILNDPQYSDMTDEEKEAFAINQVLANTAVLTAANNSDAITSDFIASLGNGTAVTQLKDSLKDDGTATDETIAKAAFAYAMYTSYNASKGIDTTGEVNLSDVYATLETEDFQYYINNNATNDIAGYQGAMSLITGSANSTDSSTVNDILLNGFNSSELVGLMQNVTAD